MTAFAFILGVLPLVISPGAGANSRRILGTTVWAACSRRRSSRSSSFPVTFYVSERFGRKPAKAPVPATVRPRSTGQRGTISRGKRAAMILRTSGWTVPAIVAAAFLARLRDRPELQAPTRWPSRHVFRGQEAAEAASLADLPWWEVFQDIILKNLIQEALGNNYDVQIAAARVQEARAQVGVARSQFFPQIGYSATVERSRVNGALFNQPNPQALTANLFYGNALRVVGAGHLGSHPSLERSGAGAPLGHRGRPARRMADAGQRPGPGVLRAPGARRAASDRPGQHGCLPGHLQPVPGSAQGGCRLEARDLSSRGRPRRRTGDHSLDREPDRREGEPDRHPAGQEPRADPARDADVRATDRAHGAGRAAVDAARAAPGPPPGGSSSSSAPMRSSASPRPTSSRG